MRQPEIRDHGLKFAGALTERGRTDLLVLHHAAATSCTVEDIHRWHLSFGWLGIGYHYFVDKLGGITAGRPENVVGAHAEGRNGNSIGICAEGDFSKEQMSPPQEQAIIDLVKWILGRYPGIVVKGHRDLNATECPGEHYPFSEIVIAARGTLILGEPQATAGQAQAWARARGAAQCFIDIAPLYWHEASGRGGVRPEVAYAQSAKETGFGRFGGVIPGSEWHNWCGLKTSSGGANNDPSAHARFPDDLTGVRAHLDHLALYAGADGYPMDGTPDPRHFPFIRGSAETVEGLSGRWAPAPDYGDSIIEGYLTGLLATPNPKGSEEEKLRAEIARLEAQVMALTSQRGELKERIQRAKDALTIEA